MPILSRLTSFVLQSLLLLSGCQLPITDSGAAGHDYFPLETDRYVIYGVEEQQFSLNAPPVSRTYQLKERIGQPYTDVTGQTAYRLFRYRRTTENQPWQADSVWAVRLVNNEAIRTENGRDFVRLVLPVANQLSWDSNRYNQLGRDDYTIRNAGQPYRVQDKPFDETVTVSKQLDSTLISVKKRIDVYARQVGLIYAERVAVQFCTATPACSGRNQIDYGTKQVYRIQTYGIE
ncbi:hypothetical protein [Spirosoma spitsbergense]|uniref:hypothetical protein n=1 Tax=Spirosoma spitsbergense TaxID=431554 RepID=UPI00035D42B1|nr:hypothetical protein [Spirosoma spitsbergense]